MELSRRMVRFPTLKIVQPSTGERETHHSDDRVQEVSKRRECVIAISDREAVNVMSDRPDFVGLPDKGDRDAPIENIGVNAKRETPQPVTWLRDGRALRSNLSGMRPVCISPSPPIFRKNLPGKDLGATIPVTICCERTYKWFVDISLWSGFVRD